jgi:transcriptional regulator with XRE-family HTH domain
MLTSAQCRAARALIDWSREDLASASKVGLRTIVDFERDARDPRDVTKDALYRALEAGGVLFLDAGSERNGGPGVRLQKGNSGQTIALEDLSAANDE